MSTLSFLNPFTIIQRILIAPEPIIKECVRNASKKAKGSTQNNHTKVRPKHRGIKRNDGHFVESGTKVALQRTLRFHPGLNVGFGRDGTLYALTKGRVMITCEKINPQMNHFWTKKAYGGRDHTNIYKKYFNIIAPPMHTKFNLINQI